MQPAETQNPIQLGPDIELDLRAYELRRRGCALKLERLPMDILVFLIERRGELVSREQITERIWGKAAYLDTDNNINGAIRKIRQVLKDDPRQPRFILTIPGRGYRFIMPATQTGSERADSVLPSPAVEAGASVPSEGDKRALPRSKVAFAVVLIAALGGGVLWHRSAIRVRPSSGRIMLAVLPFQNLTGDTRQEYFIDGLTEEMITQLGRLDPRQVGVIARTSVMHYKNSPAPLEQIAGELAAQYVLEGSVRRAADNVRVTVQLIQIKDRTHLWARQYDRELRDILTLQGEIAEEVAGELRLILLGEQTPATATRQTLGAPSIQTQAAYDLYLRGRYFWEKRTIEGFQQALGYYEQAVARDANFSRAYAGMADCYSLLGGYSGLPQAEFMARARSAAQRALQLDDSLPEAHTALALIVQNYDHDWDTSESEFRRAIELNPNYATAHHWYAEHLTWLGRFDQAAVEFERARQLDPLSLIIAADRAVMLYDARQYDRSLEQFQAVLDVDPKFSRARMIVAVYVEKGMFAEARSANAQQPPGSPWYWANLAYIEARARRPAEAERALQKLQELDERQDVDAGTLAIAYANMDRKDDALAWLEKALQEHSNVIVLLRVDPLFDPLRNEPRFQELLRTVGLSQDERPAVASQPPVLPRAIALDRSPRI